MANVFVGFHDQRSCNRILKPPGGGTSNIFGGDLIPDVVPQHSHRREANHRGSTIQDVLKTETTSVSTATNGESGASTPDVAEVSCKVEHLKIEEKSEVTVTDASGNTEVISSESNSEGSVEQNSSFKKGSTIGAILSQDEILEKRKVKSSPAQRVPPGGYSSGLW